MCKRAAAAQLMAAGNERFKKYHGTLFCHQDLKRPLQDEVGMLQESCNSPPEQNKTARLKAGKEMRSQDFVQR